MTYSERLKILREEKGLSQYRLAKLSGVSQTYISKYELGERNVGLTIIEKLLPHLGISVAEFLSDGFQRNRDDTIEPLPENDEKKEALLGKVIADVQDLDFQQLEMADSYIQFLKGK